MASPSSIPAKIQITVPKIIKHIDERELFLTYLRKPENNILFKCFILTIYQLTSSMILQLGVRALSEYLLFCNKSKQKVKIPLKINGLLDMVIILW